MARQAGLGGATGMTSGAMLAGAVALLALPSAVLAFSSRFDAAAGSQPAVDLPDSPISGSGVSGSGGQRLARAMSLHSLSKSPLYPFTPAGTANRPERSVTVAVRVDPVASRGIFVRGIRPVAVEEIGPAAPAIAPTGFNLGVARGYHNFAQTLVAPTEVKRVDMPDLASFRSGGASGGDSSRFSGRIVLDEKQAPGRAPRTFAGDVEDRVDVGGSYRVTRNLDVTAGVRYSQERDRLRPLTDGRADSQAVYVGTQFKF